MSAVEISDERRQEMEDTLLALRTVWFAYPQLRLGQLVENVAVTGTYYIPDAELVERLGDYPSDHPTSPHRAGGSE